MQRVASGSNVYNNDGLKKLKPIALQFMQAISV
jgi:hypothetical protein